MTAAPTDAKGGEADYVRWDEVEMEDLGGGVMRRFVYGNNMLMAQVKMPAGVVVPKHHHVHEQITNVITGTVEFRFGDDLDQVQVVTGGELVIIPPNLPHQVTGMADAVIIELFSPPREDWIDGSDAYLRAGAAGENT